MSAFQDLTGQKFGRLTVAWICGRGGSKGKKAAWLCFCECGQFKPVVGVDLRSGHTRSCGCLHQETLQNFCRNNRKHGQHHSAEYKIYKGAKARCNNPNHISFPYYGERGIKFLFDSFEKFLKEVGNRPSPQHSLDRINNNGHYEKGNVRWATPKEQGNNRRSKQKKAA